MGSIEKLVFRDFDVCDDWRVVFDSLYENLRESGISPCDVLKIDFGYRRVTIVYAESWRCDSINGKI